LPGPGNSTLGFGSPIRQRAFNVKVETSMDLACDSVHFGERMPVRRLVQTIDKSEFAGYLLIQFIIRRIDRKTSRSIQFSIPQVLCSHWWAQGPAGTQCAQPRTQKRLIAFSDTRATNESPLSGELLETPRLMRFRASSLQGGQLFSRFARVSSSLDFERGHAALEEPRRAKEPPPSQYLSNLQGDRGRVRPDFLAGRGLHDSVQIKRCCELATTINCSPYQPPRRGVSPFAFGAGLFDDVQQLGAYYSGLRATRPESTRRAFCTAVLTTFNDSPQFPVQPSRPMRSASTGFA